MVPEKERRQIPRAKVKWSVTMQTSQGVINTETENISTEGAFIRSWKPFRPNEVFKMLINLPTLDRPLLIDAKVVWAVFYQHVKATTQCGIGVQFIDISRRDRSIVNSMIFRGAD
jgi:hypothetical protein